MRDLYSVLGLKKDAKSQEIKSAFRKLAKRYHPDLYPNDEKAKERFSEINQAYEILGDKEKKMRYDRGEIDAEGKPKFHGFHGHSQNSNFNFNKGNAGAFDTSDIFRDLFGRGFGDFSNFGRQQNKGYSNSQKADDLKTDLSVSLEQIVSKEKISIAFSNGKMLKISLPEYVEDGQVIRLKGQGMSAPGRVPGDALITVHIKKHKKFRLENRALHYQLSLPLKDSVLGTKVEVETLEGKIGLKIPAWTNSGRIFRLKGKGLTLKNGSRDDFYVKVEITLPDEKKDSLTQFVTEKL